MSRSHAPTSPLTLTYIIRSHALHSTGGKTADDAVNWLRSNRATVDAALLRHGAVLFRGFPLAKADDFDAFVSAFDGYVRSLGTTNP